jgi:hypothetical protein
MRIPVVRINESSSNIVCLAWLAFFFPYRLKAYRLLPFSCSWPKRSDLPGWQHPYTETVSFFADYPKEA